MIIGACGLLANGREESKMWVTTTDVVVTNFDCLEFCDVAKEVLYL